MTCAGRPKRSMRVAINAMCRACIYDPAAGFGTWRQQVQVCTSLDCPLWEFRPVSSEPLPDSSKKALPTTLTHWFDQLSSRPHERPGDFQKTAISGQRQTNLGAMPEAPTEVPENIQP
jgi:hypothetical protein